jgi:hypothetical protein
VVEQIRKWHLPRIDVRLSVFDTYACIHLQYPTVLSMWFVDERKLPSKFRMWFLNTEAKPVSRTA